MYDLAFSGKLVFFTPHSLTSLHCSNSPATVLYGHSCEAFTFFVCCWVVG
ncbi:unnamed protein product [Ectocarpus sp. CCAP 1310/34]|nr:unnamed protein product [Ectocarpus sp. CCAP 1310/34]